MLFSSEFPPLCDFFSCDELLASYELLFHPPFRLIMQILLIAVSQLIPQTIFSPFKPEKIPFPP